MGRKESNQTNKQKNRSQINNLNYLKACLHKIYFIIIEPGHEISNNVVCETSEGSDQPAHTGSLIRAFADRLNIL